MRTLRFLPFVALLPLSSSCACELIEPGYVGIVINKSGDTRTISAADVKVGRIWYNPYSTAIVVYPVRVVRVVWTKTANEGAPVDESFTVNTKEGVSLNTDASLSFHMREERAPQVYTKYRQEIDTLKDGFIRDIVRDALARASATMTVDEVVGEGRGAFEDAAAKAIRDKLEPEGFTVDNFALINDIRVPASIKQRIDEKIAATQQAIGAENKLRETKAVAQQKIEEARGEAEAAKLRASGEAEANAILTKSITPALAHYRLTEKTLEKWDGKLPQVTSDKASPFLTLDQAAPAAK